MFFIDRFYWEYIYISYNRLLNYLSIDKYKLNIIDNLNSLYVIIVTSSYI